MPLVVSPRFRRAHISLISAGLGLTKSDLIVNVHLGFHHFPKCCADPLTPPLTPPCGRGTPAKRQRLAGRTSRPAPDAYRARARSGRVLDRDALISSGSGLESCTQDLTLQRSRPDPA